MAENNDTPQGLSRRTALKAGAVGGAALWTVPLAQVVGTGVAEATSAPVTPPGGGGGQLEYPSNGLIVLRRTSDGALFGLQYEYDTARFNSAGGSVQRAYLAGKVGSYDELPSYAGFSVTFGANADGGTYTVRIPAGYTIVLTATKDGPNYFDNGGSLTFGKQK